MAMLIREYLDDSGSTPGCRSSPPTSTRRPSPRPGPGSIPTISGRRWGRSGSRPSSPGATALAGGETAAGDDRLRPPQPHQGSPLLAARPPGLPQFPHLSQPGHAETAHLPLPPGAETGRVPLSRRLGNGGAHSDLFTAVDKKWKIFQRLERRSRPELFPLHRPVPDLPGRAVPAHGRSRSRPPARWRKGSSWSATPPPA